MNKILKYVLMEVLRNRVLIIYALLLFMLSNGLFLMNDEQDKTLLSLLQVVLLVVPLISCIMATIHFYNSKEFMELLLTQPIKRSTVFIGEFLGICISLTMALVFGILLPMLIYDLTATGLTLFFTSVLLSLCFTALAFLASVYTGDKAKGIGLSLFLWFFFSVLFSGITLFILYNFSDYPLEKVMLVLSALDPIELARVLVLLHLDTSALMGYTGALYQQILGTYWGMSFAFLLLIIWVIVPFYFALKIFRKKDL